MAAAVIDHVAFLVSSLDAALEALGDVALEAQPVQTFAAEGTRECYLGAPGQTGRVLLIEAVGDGPYAEAFDRRGPGLHHVALGVSDVGSFVDEVVDGSGWLVHPSSFRSRRDAGCVWLARPGVEALVECMRVAREHGAAAPAARAGGILERVVLAGLDIRDGLSGIFEDSSVEVVSGPRSGVTVAGRFVAAPGESQAAERQLEDTAEYNRRAWNRKVDSGDRWTVGVSPAEVERARGGEVDILLTPCRPVPAEWLGELDAADVLCLASGGGQQGPILAAAGANVTVFDASDAQLARDREVARREGLAVETVRGDMRDLSAFDDASFDLVVNPCSVCFVEDVLPVWREAYRVLRPGGQLLAGLNNPVAYCFDWSSVERGNPRLRYRLPYRDVDHLDDPYVARAVADGHPVEFGHTLEDLLGGQLAAGFVLVDFYEDPWGSGDFPDACFDGFMATRARKRRHP